MRTISLLDLMQELCSFHSFTDEQLAAAKQKKITNRNTPLFRQLVENWSNGLYDGDLDVIVERVLSFIDK